MEWIKQKWTSLALDRGLLISMVRNSLPPTAALLVIQSSRLGKSFDTVGYLPIILCILQQPIQPRVQFLKSILVTCILSCFVACFCILAGWCSIQARLHTTPPGGNISAYNSSAAVVSGVWVMFLVWALQTFRVYRPQYTTSCVISTILAIVSVTSSARLTTKTAITRFVSQLLEMFFLAHSFGVATNLLILPTTSRGLVFADIRNYLSLVQKILLLETSYLECLEHSSTPTNNSKERDGDFSEEPLQDEFNISCQEKYQALTESIKELSMLHGQMRLDVSFAKHDFGWSAISGADFDTLANHFRNLIISLRGMSVLMPLFRKLSRGKTDDQFDDISGDHLDTQSIETSDLSSNDEMEWKTIFADLRKPVEDVNILMQDGLKHVSMSLNLDESTSIISRVVCGFLHRKRTKADIESSEKNRPGSETFAQCYEERMMQLSKHKGATLRHWLQRRQAENGTTNVVGNQLRTEPSGKTITKSQQQLFVILYMQHLFRHVSDEVLELVRFAESKNTRSSKDRKKFVWPTFQSFSKIFEHFTSEDESHEDYDNGISQSTWTNLDTWAGHSSLRSSQHPVIQGLVRAYRVVGSEQSFFGFRVAAAVMTIVVVALLEQTQQWFFNRRALWAAVFIPFSMSPNSGETLSLLGFRLVGSAWAVVFAIVNWYIVDGTPAGVIVFFFFFTVFEEYFMIKMPQYGSIWRPALITRAIITGYSLQTQVSRMPTPPATITNAYPIYYIGPYRYLCTMVGVTAAFIWTVFPRAVSARSMARKKLGQSLALLALYYTCVHSTIGLWATNKQGDMNDLSSPGQRLRTIREKLFSQQMVILSAIQQHVRFSRFEPSMGNQFQRDLYGKITQEIDTVTSHMNMMVYAAGTLQPAGKGESHDATVWAEYIAQAFRSADFNSNNVSAILSVLHIAVTNNQPLPPGIKTPESYHLAMQIKRVHPEMLTSAHAEDPSYAALAVIETGASMMYESMGRLLGLVKELVGVVEFFPLEDEKAGKQA